MQENLIRQHKLPLLKIYYIDKSRKSPLTRRHLKIIKPQGQTIRDHFVILLWQLKNKECAPLGGVICHCFSDFYSPENIRKGRIIIDLSSINSVSWRNVPKLIKICTPLPFSQEGMILICPSSFIFIASLYNFDGILSSNDKSQKTARLNRMARIDTFFIQLKTH